MQLLVITTPPDVQLSCLSIEVTEQQSLVLLELAAEDDSCYLELPAAAVAGERKSSQRYGRIFHQTGQWFLEPYQSEQFRVNEQNHTLEVNRPQPLGDGDLIECYGYTLMFSDFSPWKADAQPAPVLRESLSAETNVYTALKPDTQFEKDGMDDPFALLEQQDETEACTDDIALKTASHSTVNVDKSPVSERQKSLINVLADFSDDSPADEKSLWTGEQQLNFNDDFLSGHPLTTTSVPSASHLNPVLQALTDRNVEKALLRSLAITLASVSPAAIAAKTQWSGRSFFRNKQDHWQNLCQKTFDQLVSSRDFKQQYLKCLRTCYEEIRE